MNNNKILLQFTDKELLEHVLRKIKPSSVVKEYEIQLRNGADLDRDWVEGSRIGSELACYLRLQFDDKGSLMLIGFEKDYV